MAKGFLHIYALLLLVALPVSAQAAEALQSPYPARAESTEAASCPKAPKPIRDLEFTSVYTDRSDGLSHVDPVALDAYNEAIEPLRIFERHVARDITAGKANCAAAWLYRWASGEALLGTVNNQGVAVRKWSLASFSSLYMQIRNDPSIPNGQRRIIDAWLNLVAQTVRNDYSRGSKDRASLHNNHLYWAAWATMATSIVTNDRELFNWSVAQYKTGIDDIGPDGTLPHEIGRMKKALHYHVFSAGPLVMMAETAQANGIDLYGYKDGAIHRLIGRITTELDNDGAYMAEKTGTKQDMDGVIGSATLAWMEPYAARFPDKQYDTWFKKLRPMVQRRLGGDLTLLFGTHSP